MPKTTLSTDMDYSERRKRRNAIMVIKMHLSAICDAEQCYLDKVPDNLHNSESFEVGELAVDALDEIINLLGDVY